MSLACSVDDRVFDGGKGGKMAIWASMTGLSCRGIVDVEYKLTLLRRCSSGVGRLIRMIDSRYQLIRPPMSADLAARWHFAVLCLNGSAVEPTARNQKPWLKSLVGQDQKVTQVGAGLPSDGSCVQLESTAYLNL